MRPELCKDSQRTEYTRFVVSVHVDGVRLRLWTAATRRRTVHPQVIHEHGRATVNWYWQRKTPDSSTRAVCQFCQQSHLVANQDNVEKELLNFASKVFLILVWFFNMPTWSQQFYFACEGSSATDFYRPRLDLNPLILNTAASTVTTRPPRAT
jgi:hypothetical protein